MMASPRAREKKARMVMEAKVTRQQPNATYFDVSCQIEGSNEHVKNVRRPHRRRRP